MAKVPMEPVAIATVDPERTFLEAVALSPNYAQDGTLMVSLQIGRAHV